MRVRVKATSLNYRDLAVVRGFYMVSTKEPLVPGSDAAGLVVETGPGVTAFKPGERVRHQLFSPDWVEGRMSVPRIRTALGGGGAGTFAEEIVLPENRAGEKPHAPR